jgi:hypothetical protein
LKLHALLLRGCFVKEAGELRQKIMQKIGEGQSPYNYDLVLAAEVRAMGIER